MDFNLISEVICFLSGIIAWNSIEPRYMRFILLLFSIDIVNEIFITKYFINTGKFDQNIFYNLYSFFDMGFGFYIFYCIHKKTYLSKCVIVGGLICFSYTLLELFYIHGLRYLHIDSLRLFDFFIILFSFGYLHRILKKRYHKLLPDILFWYSAGSIILHSLLFLNFSTMAENRYWLFEKAEDIFYLLGDIGNVFYFSVLNVAFCLCIYYNKAQLAIFSHKL